jgi:hypothetical protein
MKVDAEAGRATPYSLNEINKSLVRDKELKQVEKKKQNLEIAQTALEAGAIALQLMEAFNIGSEKDRKYVATGLAVAEIGVRAYAGDYKGAVAGAISLFKKPKPTPEMQMLMQINERLAALEQTINEGFRGLHDHLTSVGFTPIDDWRSCVFHDALGLYLVVYVDDFKMDCTKQNLPHGWALIRQQVRMEAPSPLCNYSPSPLLALTK